MASCEGDSINPAVLSLSLIKCSTSDICNFLFLAFVSSYNSSSSMTLLRSLLLQCEIGIVSVDSKLSIQSLYNQFSISPYPFIRAFLEGFEVAISAQLRFD